MDLHTLYIELERVQREKECVRDNMFDDRLAVSRATTSKDPWVHWEASKSSHYIGEDGKIYSRLVNRELRLLKLIARQEKNYAWSVRRFKCERSC